METAVTFIVATWNEELSIQTTIASILEQTDDDWSAIVVDGASQDGTADIVRAFGHGDIRLISEVDQGIYDAWNKGVHEAEGRWVTFLGAGDEISADYVAKLKQVEAQVGRNVNLITGLVRARLYGRWHTIGKSWHGPSRMRYMRVAHTGTAHRRELILTYKGFDTRYKIVGDFDFLIRADDSICATHISYIWATTRPDGISTDAWAAIKETAVMKRRNGVSSAIGVWCYAIAAIVKHYLRKGFAKVEKLSQIGRRGR